MMQCVASFRPCRASTVLPEDVTYTLDKGGDATKNNVTINCKIWSLLLNNDTVEDENVTKQ